MFDSTAFIEKEKRELEAIRQNFNEEDLAYLLFSGYFINSQKTAMEKIAAFVNALSTYKNFKNYLIEFYFLKTEKLRLTACYGITLNQNVKYIGISADSQGLLASMLGKQGWKEEDEPALKDKKRAKLLAELKIKKSIYFPINATGVLAISKQTFSDFTADEKIFVHHFIKMNLQPSLALALENETNIERAITDQMTALYNHTFFKIRLKEEATNIQRETGRPLSLVMIDIDYFKNYNDLNGHPKGDIVIKAIAKTLKKQTRTSDVVARYGGEEFAILMPNTHLADATSKAESIRRAVLDLKFENEKSQPNKKITISLGVANIPMNALTPDSLLERADKALYFSKENGKNKVTIYSTNIEAIKRN